MPKEEALQNDSPSSFDHNNNNAPISQGACQNLSFDHIGLFLKQLDGFFISPVHFRRLFSKATGMPPWHYVLDCRIRYASQLLLATDKLIKEIAGECGFNGVFHFSREFKKIMKKSPENFRKSI